MKQNGLIVVLLALLIASQSAMAAQGAVSLVATINEQPAMMKMKWTQDGELISRKHSDVLHVAPGKYRYCGTIGETTRCRNVTVLADHTTMVVFDFTGYIE